MDDSSANRGPRSISATPATNGRIMVVSVVICFVALLIIAFFHMYTRWFLVTSRRQSSRLQNHRVRHQARDHNSSSSSNDATANATRSNVGQRLPTSILKALPTFLYSINTTREADSPECAVCLSEFVDGETGRILPNCKHWFHVDCIDMWFRTHSSCPLCRAPVQNPDGTLVILVQLQPELIDASPDYFTLPRVWSSFVHDRKLPELTSVRVETLAEATGVKQHAQGSSDPVSSSGSNGQSANK